MPLISDAPGGKQGLDAPREQLFGLHFSIVDMQSAVAHLDHVMRAGGSKVVFTANVDHVVRFNRDPGFCECYGAADMVLVDGVPLLWAARLLSRNTLARVAGIDLFFALCALASLKGYRCFLLGGSQGTLNKACEALRRRFPELQIVGSHHGYFKESGPVLEAIRSTCPSLLFVGMGSPLQEKWIARHRGELPGVVVAVGGSFTVIAGEKIRAPRWVQHIGFEWMWRLLQEPHRLWKRYLWEDLAFLKLFYRELQAR